MTAIELINRIECLPKGTTIFFIDSFGGLKTTDFFCHSWRAAYHLPATNIRSIEKSEDGCTRETALKNLKDVNNKVVPGYKGGVYVLNDCSNIYLVDNPTSAGDATIITSIYESGHCEIGTDPSWEL